MQVLRNQMIYQVFVRNYSAQGTFKALTSDLKRIQALGTDILYLLPIQPIGELNRKGVYGSPYAIKDYCALSPDLGDWDDFKELVDQTHALGMKLMLDMVFHHTAPDHPWTIEHPEFYHWKNGKLSNKVGDWSDIADFEFEDNPQLIKNLMDVLRFWIDKGMDGFRFDVASMIPHHFYQTAFPTVLKLNPDLIFLAESVDQNFVDYLRYHGHTCLSDAELYAYFHILYDYDNQAQFMAYLHNELPLKDFIMAHRRQERMYPVDYVKARNVENHDNHRIQAYTQDKYKTLNWLAYVFMAKGIAFLHFGVETVSDHLSQLFDKDPVDWTKIDPEFVDWITALAKLKKEPIFAQNAGYKLIDHPKDIIHIEYTNGLERLVILCNVSHSTGMVRIDCEEGVYKHLITGDSIDIRHGQVMLRDTPIIFKV